MNQCSECRGSGKYVGLTSVEPCAACGGTGDEANFLKARMKARAELPSPTDQDVIDQATDGSRVIELYESRQFAKAEHNPSEPCIYDWRNGNLPPARAWDAAGKELPTHTYYVNARTGYVLFYRTDESGAVMAGDDGDLARSSAYLPAPIRVEFMEPINGRR